MPDASQYKLERSPDGSTGWTTADTGADSIVGTTYTVTGAGLQHALLLQGERAGRRLALLDDLWEHVLDRVENDLGVPGRAGTERSQCNVV